MLAGLNNSKLQPYHLTTLLCWIYSCTTPAINLKIELDYEAEELEPYVEGCGTGKALDTDAEAYDCIRRKEELIFTV